jgi:hypothetical protein
MEVEWVHTIIHVGKAFSRTNSWLLGVKTTPIGDKIALLGKFAYPVLRLPNV